MDASDRREGEPGRVRPWLRAVAMAAGLVGLAAVGLVADRHPADAATAARTVAVSATSAAASAPASGATGTAGSGVAAPVASASAAPVASVPAAGTLPDGRVVLNLATEEDLRKLPGLGPKRVQAILELRQRQGGRFRAVADLLRVKGLGRKTLARLAPRLVLDPPPGA